MFEMYGLVEVMENQQLTFYFVTIELEEEHINLIDRTDGKKPLNIKIPLDEIKNFKTHTIFNTEEISFDYLGVTYKFIEYGNLTISLFSRLLEEKMYLVNY